MGKLSILRMSILILLVIAITTASAFLINMYNSSKSPIEITTSQTPKLTVDIRGEVQNPGFYKLDLGYSIGDAIQAAGGFTDYAASDLITINTDLKNMAFIYVSDTSDAPQRINLNTADVWLLDALPGIGEMLAQRIIDYRDENGPFMDIDAIKNVFGIGDSKFDKIKEKIRV